MAGLTSGQGFGASRWEAWRSEDRWNEEYLLKVLNAGHQMRLPWVPGQGSGHYPCRFLLFRRFPFLLVTSICTAHGYAALALLASDRTR